MILQILFVTFVFAAFFVNGLVWRNVLQQVQRRLATEYDLEMFEALTAKKEEPAPSEAPA